MSAAMHQRNVDKKCVANASTRARCKPRERDVAPTARARARSRAALFGNGYGGPADSASAVSARRRCSCASRPARHSPLTIAAPACARAAPRPQGAAYNTSFMERENDDHISLLHGKAGRGARAARGWVHAPSR